MAYEVSLITGDGVGPEIWAAARRVLDAAVAIAYGGRREVDWVEIFAGGKAVERFGPGEWLPDETLDAVFGE